MPNSSPAPPQPLLTLEELVWLHTVAIEEFGGSPGVRDKGLLESALARPLAGFEGHSMFTTPFQRAGALAESLVQNHGFVDGNKRTAMYAMAAWLEREGFRLEAARGELRDLALGLAEHRIGAADAALWLEHRAVPAGEPDKVDDDLLGDR